VSILIRREAAFAAMRPTLLFKLMMMMMIMMMFVCLIAGFVCLFVWGFD
jgi:hypothetical protein